ncbi:phosphopantothenoylcysteine decarboxylase/phosphopantothenate/cysteine ligase [Ignisphaera aggregans DSM 17230]|uniref:Coenzyme A biosynthesis bifunctional protein CoaBC n=1 Tax=Ignisphaera aggregans (strain DSM 17230 / JCM 13409 / AQ1.S1) TaxID=583356 RepID=E0SQ15_IGNAA|nr:phosphopantothenoylcysteine decarboxylase/phosphopantothenate/cysteine ligase [Ignisphaera aggregans DSM 17230]
MLRDTIFHPVDEIRGTRSRHLEGIKFVFGLTGSTAIYRAIDVMRELIRRGAEIYVVMSQKATELIGPKLIEWATGSKVYTDFGGETGHVALSVEGNSLTVIPATADIVSKIATGICDNPVSLLATMFLGINKPIIIVPAMHEGLWRSPPIVKAIEYLESLGVTIVSPDIAGGRARIAGVEDIVTAIEAVTLRGKDLKGLRILVTAGPTREKLDSIRFLTNPSSGRMGVAIAREAYFRGADVTLVHGPLTVSRPYYVRSIYVETAEDMLKAVIDEVRSRSYDAIILAGAPSDFRFKTVYRGKLSSDVDELTVVLERTPKIIDRLREVYKGLVIGFAAEFAEGDIGRLEELAKRKLFERGFDYIVANDVSRQDIGFVSEYNEVLIIGRNGLRIHIEKSLKDVIARRILDMVRDELRNRG